MGNKIKCPLCKSEKVSEEFKIKCNVSEIGSRVSWSNIYLRYCKDCGITFNGRCQK